MNLEQKIQKLAAEQAYTVRFHDGVVDLWDRTGGIPWLDAPLDEALERLQHPQGAELLKENVAALRRRGGPDCGIVEVDHFDIFGIIKWPGHLPICLARKKSGGKYAYCVRPDGRGRYFNTLWDALDYAIALRAKPMTSKRWFALEDAYSRKSEKGRFVDPDLE